MRWLCIQDHPTRVSEPGASEEAHNRFADMAKVAIALGDSARQVLVNRSRATDRDDAMDDLGIWHY